MKSLKLLAAVAALVMLAACAKPVAQLSGAADGDDGMFAVGTVASIGSFEFKAAPLYTQLAIARHQAAVKLRHREISVDQAQAVQDAADKVRKLLDSALSTCAQDEKTGKCTKNPAAADALLVSAFDAFPSVK